MSLYNDNNTLQEEIHLAKQIKKDVEIIKRGKKTKCKFCRKKHHIVRPIIVRPGITPTQFGIAYGDEKRMLACLVCRSDIMNEGWTPRQSIKTSSVEYPLVWQYIRDDVRFRD